jgi:hypothetical protein
MTSAARESAPCAGAQAPRAARDHGMRSSAHPALGEPAPGIRRSPHSGTGGATGHTPTAAVVASKVPPTSSSARAQQPNCPRTRATGPRCAPTPRGRHARDLGVTPRPKTGSHHPYQAQSRPSAPRRDRPAGRTGAGTPSRGARPESTSRGRCALTLVRCCVPVRGRQPGPRHAMCSRRRGPPGRTQALLPGTDCPASRNPPDHHVVHGMT